MRIGGYNRMALGAGRWCWNAGPGLGRRSRRIDREWEAQAVAQRRAPNAQRQLRTRWMMSSTTPEHDEDLRAVVREKYGAAALRVNAGGSSCCGASSASGCGPDPITSNHYLGDEASEVPPEALAASLGCGNPTALAELRAGETVLDLGSGGGIDVLLSARRVGPTGKAYGVDMTDEMLALARANAAKAGARNVEFVKGTIEAVPLPDESIDIIISNCVITLSTDKPAVLTEAHRLLRPGGRFGVSDVVAENHLDAAQRAERGSYVSCIAGALSIGEYRDGLAAAGFTDITVSPTHQVADGMHSAII